MKYFENGDVNEAFLDWIEMRKKIKKPVTERAIMIAIKKLNQLSGGSEEKTIEIIENSIFHSWQGFYPLRDQSEPGGIEW